MSDISNMIDEGIAELFDPAKFKGYLQSMSHFHGYSWRNILLIFMQMPHATKLAEYNRWKTQYGRHVRKGTTTISIYTPIEQEPQKKLIERIDPITKTTILDNNGKRVMEEIITHMPPQFKETKVLDVSQTEGKPLLRIAGDVFVNDSLCDTLFESFKRLYPSYVQDGITHEGLPVIIRQICHERQDKMQLSNNWNWKNFALESIAYIICYRFGIDSAVLPQMPPNEAQDPKTLVVVLEVIRSQANSIITSIKDMFTLVCNERNISPLTPVKTQTPAEEPITPSIAKEEIVTSSQVEIPLKGAITDTPVLAEIPKTEPPKPIKIPPDSAINITDRNQYGYTRPEILPLTRNRAEVLFTRDMTIYLLYSDNTESMAFYLSDIQNHDGIFGVPQSQWQNSREYMAFISGDPDAVCEAKFIYDTNDSFAVFQLNHEDKMLEPYIFKTYEQLQDLQIDRSNYRIVYSAPLPQPPTPEGIFMWFNAEKIDGYTGRQMHISDVLSIQKEGVITSYYVNGRNFKELLSFLGLEGQNKRPSNPSDNAPESDSSASQSTANTGVVSASIYHPAVNTDMQPVQVPPDVIIESEDTPANIIPNVPLPPTTPLTIPIHATEIAVYTQSAEKAAEYGHTEDYERNKQINIACCEALDKEIQASKRGNDKYKLVAALQKLIREYGENRIVWVLGIHIYHNPDGFSPKVFAWVENALSLLGFDENGQLLIPSEIPPFTIKTSQTVLEAFIKRFEENSNRKKTFSERVEKAKKDSQESVAHLG